jgi:hypothetical protein
MIYLLCFSIKTSELYYCLQQKNTKSILRKRNSLSLLWIISMRGVPMFDLGKAKMTLKTSEGRPGTMMTRLMKITEFRFKNINRATLCTR